MQGFVLPVSKENFRNCYVTTGQIERGCGLSGKDYAYMEIIDLALNLANSMAVIMVVTYVLTRSRFYAQIMAGDLSVRNRLYLVLIFGAFSVYGTVSGIELLDAVANTRDLGPTIAGLLGGPLVGLGAGLIGGIHRFALGGFTQYSCSLSTVLAGLIGGLVWHLRKGKFPGIRDAALLSVGIELFHMALTLVISRPFGQAVALVRQVILPMVLANGAGMAFFAFMLHNLSREKATEKAKLEIEGELQAARQIQMSIVPRVFPPFPDRPEFEIHALLEPAREVGGDFYDFFLIGTHHLCFLVGDVSGKGVPASLYMAVTRTLLRSRASGDPAPDEILAAVNTELCRDNDTGMFVTVFCGVLDIRTGETVYSCGGHELPCLLSGPEISTVPPAKGTALGAMEGLPYHREMIRMSPGDTLVLFTDGVTEAMNGAGEFWGKEGLLKALQEVPRHPAPAVTEGVSGALKQFAGDAPQYDDITILTLTYYGESPRQ